MPGQAKIPQQRQAQLQVSGRRPQLVLRKITVGNLVNAQRIRALRSLFLESIGGLPVSLDSRAMTAEAIVAVAEQVKEVRTVKQLPSGSPTHLHCHSGPSGSPPATQALISISPQPRPSR